MRGKVKRCWALFLLALLFGIFCRLPQVEAGNAYEVLWHETYTFGSVNGGSLVDVASDGEIIVAGHTYFGLFSNFLIFKTDKNGTLKWNRTLAYSDVAYAVKALPNGDILAVGYQYAFLGLYPDSLTISRFDSEGNNTEHHSYSVPYSNRVQDAIISSNEDVIVVGDSVEYGEEEWPEEDVWVLKLDKNASVKLNKTYDISQSDVAHTVVMTSNGDIIVAGESGNNDARDFLVLRLDEDGNLKWQKTFDKKYEDRAYAVAVVPNGDIVVAGQTKNEEDDVYDAWVIRLDSNGNIIWQKLFGGSEEDGINSITVLSNGDIVLVGYTNSFGASNMDAWILVLGSSGNVKWNYNYDVGNDDSANSVDVALNGNIVVAGWSGDDILLMAIKIPERQFGPILPITGNPYILMAHTWTSWFFMYHDIFEELYSTAVSLGVDNETLEMALELHNNATDLILDAWRCDSLEEILRRMQLGVIPKLYNIRKAFLMELEAINTLKDAINELQPY